MIKPQPYKLKNTIQHYDWGTKRKNAFIPKLMNIKPEKDKPYAELWMGAHPKASSRIVIDGKEIEMLKAIRKYPNEMLGSKTAKSFSNTLPFLFKVLSANEALSIQVHPNIKQAIALHKKDSINYPDANQKHEIAIALDSLTALVGFKPLKQILSTLKKYPEISNLFDEFSKTVETVKRFGLNKVLSGINPAENGNTYTPMNRFNGLPDGLSSSENQRKFVQRIFKVLIKKSSSHPNELNFTIENLRYRISKKKTKTEIEKHFINLHKKYQSDVGLLLLFFLNLVHLKRGEAIFTKPGIPHAYLKGNILECMSNSDNVIRAGLTPKHKDFESLLNILTFDLTVPKIINGKKKSNAITYKTDAKEFEIQLFTLSKSELKFEREAGPKIILVLEGAIELLYADVVRTKSEKILKGKSVFLPSILSEFTINSNNHSRFVLVRVPS